MNELKERFPAFWQASGAYLRRAIYARTDLETEVPVGGSRLGGVPDFPAELQWFCRDSGRPLSFLGQINLQEVSPLDEAHELPDRGLLYFFYDYSQEDGGMPWGFDPADRDGFRAYWYDGPMDALSPRQAPEDLDEELIFPQAALQFSAGEELPDPDSDLLLTADLPDEETEDFFDYLDEIEEPGTKLLGHARCQQYGMELQCASVTQGNYLGNGENFLSNPELAKPWRLLFQLDSEDDANMMWGDCGMLYFWMRQEDLQARRFDRAWMILQCG